MLIVSGNYCLDTDDFVVEDYTKVYDNMRLPFIYVESIDDKLPDQFKSDKLCFLTLDSGLEKRVVYIWFEGYYMELGFDYRAGIIYINNRVIRHMTLRFMREGLAMFGIYEGKLLIQTESKHTVFVENGQAVGDFQDYDDCVFIPMSRSTFLRKVFMMNS